MSNQCKQQIMSVRSAESDRKSSCLFADRVAKLSIDFFKEHCPKNLQNAYKQTVVSTFVVQFPNQHVQEGNKLDQRDVDYATDLVVASLGVGTKFMSANDITLHRTLQDGEYAGDKVIRDSHAEVLARRGFLRYLYDQLELFLFLKEQGSLLDADSLKDFQSLCIFESSTLPLGARASLKPDVRIHMYTSSQPCGNASIKRWAKSKQPVFQASLSPDEYMPVLHPVSGGSAGAGTKTGTGGQMLPPVAVHARIQITNSSRVEGHVSLLVKKNNGGKEAGGAGGGAG
jgi:hypothetical protein